MPIFKIEILHLDLIFNVSKCIPKNTYKWSNFFSWLLVLCSIGEHNFFQSIFQDRYFGFSKMFWFLKKKKIRTAMKILFYTYMCVYRILLEVEVFVQRAYIFFILIVLNCSEEVYQFTLSINNVKEWLGRVIIRFCDLYQADEWQHLPHGLWFLISSFFHSFKLAKFCYSCPIFLLFCWVIFLLIYRNSLHTVEIRGFLVIISST